MKSRSKKIAIVNKKQSQTGRIIILTGARQTGKTTLAMKCFPEYEYLSIEDPVLRIGYKSLTASQWHSFYPMAILDEVQKEPQLIESIKAVYDQYEKTRYVLLGSSQLLLLQKVKESLAGRCHIEDLYPLTLPEILTDGWNNEIKPSFLQQYLMTSEIPQLLPSFELYKNFPQREEAFEYYLHFGGYPALINPEFTDDERTSWLSNYVRTYLERDIRDLADFRNLEPFIKTQKITSLLTGQLINYSSLAREAGVTSKTAQKFLHYLELSYQAILLQPWYRNSFKRLNKSPKIHYLDPGIQKTIIQKTGTLMGNEFESAIIAEIFKQIHNTGSSFPLYHLRTLDGREIDLLIETVKGYIAIEIKMSRHIVNSDARNIRGLDDILDKPVIHSFILSNDRDIKQLANGTWAMPAAMFLT